MNIKRLISSILLMTVPASTLVSCHKAEKPLVKDKEYSILFIGNSYTYYNDMPNIFKTAAEWAGYSLTVASITKGGWTLEKYASPDDEYGAKVNKAFNEAEYGQYDYVIIQEQSIRPITNPDSFYTAARTLVERVKAIGATPIFYSTWGRKGGSETLVKYGLTNESMTWKMAAAYSAIGNELDVEVAYVGLAFHDIHTSEENTIDLYNPDLSHPSYSGSYLAAITLFAAIFNTDPREVYYNAELNYTSADTLRRAAYTAVFDTPKIPLEYKIKTSK